MKARISVSGTRTALHVPLRRDRRAIGVIVIRRTRVQPFTRHQIALLKTFADQAAIAIENARLFTELQEKNRALTEAHGQVTEALEQQTATAEILRVISRSPTAIEPVLDAVAEAALRLCAAVDVVIGLRDGDSWIIAVHQGAIPGHPLGFRRPLDRSSTIGGAIIDARTIDNPDIDQLDPADYPYTKDSSVRFGFKAAVAAPLLRTGVAIGAILLRRMERGAFKPRQIELLETFADQAVIAIENVRLFKELEMRNRDLTEALNQQTAISEILRVINSSPTSVAPVFDAILVNGLRLCQADVGLFFLVENGMFRLVADRGAPPEFADPRRTSHTSGPRTGLTRAVREGRPIQIEDMLADRAYAERDPRRLETVELLGARTGVWVPLMKDGTPIGVLVTWRREVRPFTGPQIDVLTTFADQAVLMDVQLPKLSGIEATRRLRADPATAETPIVAITSFALSGDEQKAKEAGASAYLAKPYSPFALLSMIRKLVPER